MADDALPDVGSLHARMEWPAGLRYVSVSTAEGNCLQRLVRDRKAARTLEIGFAYGGSTAAIMSGHDQTLPGCRHVCIDPNQYSLGKIGLSNMERLGLSGRLEFRPGRSDEVVPVLHAEGRRFDFAFIDGGHLFDEIIVDFSLVDRVLDVGGTVVLHDTWMRSTRTAVSFIRRNRADYVEERVGARNLAVFRKVAEDRREWYHFVGFRTFRGIVSQWRVMRRVRRFVGGGAIAGPSQPR